MSTVPTAELLIRLGVGLVMILFGLSQLKSPSKWLAYLPRPVRFIMPLKATTFMRTHAIGNLAIGILLLSGWWQPGATWLTLAWWVSNLPFAFYYGYTTGLRDFAIIMSLVSLLILYSAK